MGLLLYHRIISSTFTKYQASKLICPRCQASFMTVMPKHCKLCGTGLRPAIIANLKRIIRQGLDHKKCCHYDHLIMINLSNISLSFNKINILSAICLDFKAQKTHVLLGPRDVVSTLLKIILGIYTPTKGKVFINGTLLSSANKRQFCTKNRLLCSRWRIFPSLTAKENVLLVSKLRRHDLTKLKKG